jgi:hypothetical protein
VDEAFIKALLEKLARLNAWLRKPGRTPLFFTLLILGLALIYYGSYYRHDLRFRDEGGTVALNAQRLLNGERPLADVTLNYNVLWYYPVVWLYHVFGVNFVLMRAWFFALSTVAALLAFFTVKRASGLPWLAFGVALLCLLVPGMIFKNYIPLLVIANSSLLMRAALSASGSRASFVHVIAGGVLVGVTFLIRIDLGWFFTLLWLGLHLLRVFDRATRWGPSIGAACAGIALTLGLAWAVHLPVLHDAQRRGFERPFKAQYLGIVQLIDSSLRARLGMSPPPTRAKAGEGARHEKWNREILRRNAWRDFVSAPNWQTRGMVVLTYLPIATISIAVAWALLRLGRSRSGGADATATFRHATAALVLLGGALTAFPQFFFFRPDSPHLSEFSPGYWVAITGALLLLVREWKLPARIFAAILVLHASLYLARMMPDRWTGTIAARQDHDARFVAENGVDVFVSANELPVLQELCRVVREHSQPDEFLVAYPYHPTLNVITNRRTYEKDVYIDNATRTRNWDDEAIARFEKFRPAVIVLSDWAVNGHEASRFSKWAAKTKAWIEQHYHARGTFKTGVDEFVVFTRD